MSYKGFYSWSKQSRPPLILNNTVYTIRSLQKIKWCHTLIIKYSLQELEAHIDVLPSSISALAHFCITEQDALNRNITI